MRVRGKAMKIIQITGAVSARLGGKGPTWLMPPEWSAENDFLDKVCLYRGKLSKATKQVFWCVHESELFNEEMKQPSPRPFSRVTQGTNAPLGQKETQTPAPSEGRLFWRLLQALPDKIRLLNLEAFGLQGVHMQCQEMPNLNARRGLVAQAFKRWRWCSVSINISSGLDLYTLYFFFLFWYTILFFCSFCQPFWYTCEKNHLFSRLFGVIISSRKPTTKN